MTAAQSRRASHGLFKGFAHVWTPVLRAVQLRARPVRLILAGEALVLFRGPGDRATALLDRCPHRGASLSAGRLKDGCIECPFHGWVFDSEGRAQSVPFSPDAHKDRLGTVAFPVLEASGIIFVYTAPLDPALPPPPSELALALNGWKNRGSPSLRETLFSAHWTRAMENALDFTHLTFVHRNSIGAGIRKRLSAQPRMETNWQDTSFGARLWATVDGRSAGELQFFFPNVMRLVFTRRKNDTFLAAVPVDSSTTRMLAFGPPGRSLGVWLFQTASKFVLRQDRRVVESQTPGEIPAAGVELSVETDKATLAFRRLYDERLRNSPFC